jgi:type IV secretory pathway TrbD component
MEVAAWKIPTTKPTTKPTTSMGADMSMVIQSAWRAKSTTAAESMVVLP